jgi:PAS domain-containing protein
MDDLEFSDVLLNMVLDEIDDLIIIHDSSHTVVWMNRSALKTFGKKSDEVVGRNCYSLLGRTTCCPDCNAIDGHGPVQSNQPHTIPGTEKKFNCTSVPYRKGGKIELVVQHLRPVANQ